MHAMSSCPGSLFGLQARLARCDREIAEMERLLRQGHPDVGGLCLALMDWCSERRLLLGEAG